MATEIRDFAERVLYGVTLGDKLHDPGTLCDDARGIGLVGLIEPGRADGLQLADHADPFPRDTSLIDAPTRGRALHFFANHELLALELMALALLRFVDAPPAFRRGLASTLRDEQRHLSLYLARMAVLGTELGEVPLGGFFWRTVADLQDPAQFVAHMSLTFEQANLDHASHYLRLFAAHGDHDTAAVLHAVYEDEVRHVGFGVHWLGLWRPDADLLDAHRDALVAPVTLRRARGRGLDIQGRLRAGLSEQYVEGIANIPRSRGRPPVVHVFDPTTEAELAHPLGYSPSPADGARTRDLELLPLFFATPDDVVLVREAPRAAYLTTLQRAGVTLPEFVVTDLDGAVIDPPGLASITRVQPWGWTPTLARRLAPLRQRSVADKVPAQGWPPDLLGKPRGVAVLARVMGSEPNLDDALALGIVAHSAAAAEEAIAEIRARGYDTVVCKACFGAAGRGLVRINRDPSGATATLPAPQAAWIRRTLAQQGAIVVEPWLDRVCDLSLRLTIEAPGHARIDGVGRSLVDARGQYSGSVIGRATTGLPVDVARFLTGDGRDRQWLQRVWRRVADEVAIELLPSGYVGTVGVDAFVHRTRDGALRLRPVVELNVRVHMGHLAVHLTRLVAPGRVGVWRLLRKPREGSLAQFAAALAPIEMVGSAIVDGALPTNDPERATSVLGVLAVAADLAAAEAILSAPAARVAGSSPT